MTALKSPDETEVRYVKIIPHFGNTLEWMAINMAQHGFKVDSYEVMYAMLQSAGFMARHDPEMLEAVLANIERKDKFQPRLELPDQDDSIYDREDKDNG